MDNAAVVHIVSDGSMARSLLAEFRRDWAWRLEGCSAPECWSCQRKREFLARVDAVLGEEDRNG